MEEKTIYIPTINIEPITYRTVLSKVESLVALDISKTGTGITQWRNGVLSIERFSLKDEKDSVAVRRKFRDKMLEVFKEPVQYTMIENTIGSINYETASILSQLNVIVDDLQDMGIIDAGTIYREGNTVWKAWLEDISGYQKKIRGEIHSKQTTVDCIRLLGYTEDFGSEDESDSLGIALGTIYGRILGGAEPKEVKQKKAALKVDITKGYEIKQFSTALELTKYSAKYTDFHQMDCTTLTKPFNQYFKDTVKAVGDDKIFIVKIKTSKLGVLILQYGLDVRLEESYLFIIKKGNRKNKRK